MPYEWLVVCVTDAYSNKFLKMKTEPFLPVTAGHMPVWALWPLVIGNSSSSVPDRNAGAVGPYPRHFQNCSESDSTAVIFSEMSGFLRDLSPNVWVPQGPLPRISLQEDLNWTFFLFSNLLPLAPSAPTEYYQRGGKQLCFSHSTPYIFTDLSSCSFCMQKGCRVPPILSVALRKGGLRFGFLPSWVPSSFLSWRLNENDCCHPRSK